MSEPVLHYLPPRTDGKQTGTPIPPWTTDPAAVTCPVCLYELGIDAAPEV